MSRVDPHSLPREIGDLTQFALQGVVGNVGYCAAPAAPYALEFCNSDDVVCLLLGNIVGTAQFDADREASLEFFSDTTAFHPAGGRVKVRADHVGAGFIAFRYSQSFQSSFDDLPTAKTRKDGSRNNIRNSAIGPLAAYARARSRSEAPFTALELQSLATLVYLETMRSLGVIEVTRCRRLSDRQFRRAIEYVDSEVNCDLTCSKIADAARVPLRALFEGFKERTGMSPHRFVMNRRVARAEDLLINSNAPIVDVAMVCGFSSQQHMTMVLSNRLGRTPLQIRKHR